VARFCEGNGAKAQTERGRYSHAPKRVLPCVPIKGSGRAPLGPSGRITQATHGMVKAHSWRDLSCAAGVQVSIECIDFDNTADRLVPQLRAGSVSGRRSADGRTRWRVIFGELAGMFGVNCGLRAFFFAILACGRRRFDHVAAVLPGKGRATMPLPPTEMNDDTPFPCILFLDTRAIRAPARRSTAAAARTTIIGATNEDSPPLANLTLANCRLKANAATHLPSDQRVRAWGGGLWASGARTIAVLDGTVLEHNEGGGAVVDNGRGACARALPSRSPPLLE